ncbi:putative RNA-directed DNA polymerase [Tanacetum coccineum]
MVIKPKQAEMAIKKWTFERLAAQNKDREVLSKNLLEWDIKAENGLINEADIIKLSRKLYGIAPVLRPDGYNFNFIKSFWDVIKLDFWNCVKYFESSGKLAKGCNSSFVALIPKKNDPLSFSDYRPISLIGCIYKVIAKILASRLAKVIGSVIRSNQSAFIEGRQILDGCLVANEIIWMASIENTKFLLFKVDFEKAFDSVNWNFLLDVMRQMGFGSKWRTWIALCLSSASISVMINGSPSNEFKMERGLRQDDPLSPFLFLIVAEALQVCILDACNKGLYNGVSLAGCGANVSLLQYADDALLFGEWSRRNVVNLVHILKCFEMGSGLKVNISKSRILGVGVSVASSIGCAHGTFPFSYLGLPVGKKMRLKVGWNAIIDRFRDKLSSWKAKNLSIGGRLTLRGIYWVKWNSILLDHKFGGLGIGSLLAKNYGLLCKWKWRFLSEEEALWRMVIKVFYDEEGGFNSDPKCLGPSGIWTETIKVVNFINSHDEVFRGSFIRKIFNGNNTYFLTDQWYEDGRKLADAFPRLYALESFKDCHISDRWHMVNDSGVGNWSWIRPLNDDLASFVSHIGRLHLNADGAYKWVWSLDTSGSFKVSTLTKRIQNIRLAESIIGDHHLWNSLMPRKVNICVWRASLNRLPTRVNLDLRGINMASNLCPFCNTCVEDIEHCLINCSHSLAIWRKIWSWWNMPSLLSFPSFSIKDIALGNIGLNGSSRISKVVHGVFLTVVWSIWNWRNRIVNAQPDAIAKIKGEEIFPSIQRLSMTWIARLASLPANWNSWVAKPFELFS